MPDIAINQLSKSFNGVTVLNDIDVTIRDGEFFTLLGPSGCGKSTTLNCLAGLEQPSTGSVVIGDTPFVDVRKKLFLPPEKRNLGMVFQSYALWPHMTVRQNLELPLGLRKHSKRARAVQIDESLERVGLAHLHSRYPHELSGGQQQRVALARALVYSPSVLLLDEPLSNLDAKLREQARVWLKQLQSELGITTVYVTHDQDEALSLSDRIAVMFDGRMAQIGTPSEVYETPATLEVAGFIGSCNFLTGTVTGTERERIRIRLDAVDAEVTATDIRQPLIANQRVTIAIRPESVTFHEELTSPGNVNVIEGSIVARSYVGSRWEFSIRVGEALMEVISKSERIDGSLHIALDPHDILVFPDAVDETEVNEFAEITRRSFAQS